VTGVGKRRKLHDSFSKEEKWALCYESF